MGVHHAPQPSSHAARLAGRGALTAAAALALAGGTASLAFASTAPSVPTTQDIQGQASNGTHELQDAAKASPASHVSAHDVSSSMQHHASDAKDKAADAASALKGKAPTTAPSLPVSDMKADAGHAGDNAKNDVTHAATNWSAAAKGGLTPAEGAAQSKLMANDVQHAADNGRNDATHWAGALSGNAASAPELPSVLSFS